MARRPPTSSTSPPPPPRRRAGDHRRPGQRPRARSPESKGRGDWVTSVDREAEAAATSILRMATPEIPILAEEAGGTRAERFWVVDPLDGTTNFVLGFPMVGVSVALVESGQPTVGVVSAPELGARWAAVRGEGAFDRAGRRLDLRASPAGGRHRHRLPLPSPGVACRATSR